MIDIYNKNSNHAQLLVNKLFIELIETVCVMFDLHKILIYELLSFSIKVIQMKIAI